MKSIKFVCLVFVLLLISGINCFADDPIDLKGHWNQGKKSLSIEFPINISYENNAKLLTVNYANNLGLVTITVTNSSGVSVYIHTIQVFAFTSWPISVNCEPSGTYVISITDGTNYVSGQFQVE